MQNPSGTFSTLSYCLCSCRSFFAWHRVFAKVQVSTSPSWGKCESDPLPARYVIAWLTHQPSNKCIGLNLGLFNFGLAYPPLYKLIQFDCICIDVIKDIRCTCPGTQIFTKLSPLTNFCPLFSLLINTSLTCLCILLHYCSSWCLSVHELPSLNIRHQGSVSS